MSFLTCTLFAGNRDWAGLNRYAEANVGVSERPDVVFMGNSITDHWIGFHPDFFTDNNYLDRGIGGQTSSQMVLRFRQDVLNLRPDAVVINAGTNDCAENSGPFDPDFTFGNIISMVELAQSHGIKVILASILPAAGFGWNTNIKDAPARIADLNERIYKFALENDIPYVDYYSSMVEGQDRALNPLYTDDGVHPTADGYTVMEAIVKPIIDKTLNK